MFKMERYNKLKNEYIQEVLKLHNENKSLGLNKNDLSEIKPILLCEYMDKNGMQMPKPKYIYNEKDVTTHKYYDIGTHIKNTDMFTQVLNPLFKYGDL